MKSKQKELQDVCRTNVEVGEAEEYVIQRAINSMMERFDYRAVEYPRSQARAVCKSVYPHLLIQIGRGSYIPCREFANFPCHSSVLYFFFNTAGDDGFIAANDTFSSSIANCLRSACHAGSGSIFETLQMCKPLIVVVNEDLMDNHQVKLAEELAKREHLFCACHQTFHQTIMSTNLDSLLSYPPDHAKPVAKLVYRFLAFPED
ncbi:hypothetical protein Cgig2_008217 [Carnegiea gigantea]|uniref:Glycosyl transferase family 28 C-terminal domain-containing protein n=1 Tax=Carnegiea gigantea TaxID=171969 RepID=A0A9Q1L2J5_9CARY|nr:hypothetical protein Cgig2_008217 [Carnegiea gigantea]